MESEESASSGNMKFLHRIRCCAEQVYAGLGTGHSEIVYHKAMEVELRECGIRYESKVTLPIYYRGLTVGYGEADLIVYDGDDHALIVELKAVTYAPREGERAQLQSYMRLHGGVAEGLLVNFRQPTNGTPSPQEPDVEVIELKQPGIESKD